MWWSWNWSPQIMQEDSPRREQGLRTITDSCFVGSSLYLPLRHSRCSKHSIYIRLLQVMSPALGSFSNSEDHVSGGWVQLAQQGITSSGVFRSQWSQLEHCLDSLETCSSTGPSHWTVFLVPGNQGNTVLPLNQTCFPWAPRLAFCFTNYQFIHPELFRHHCSWEQMGEHVEKKLFSSKSRLCWPCPGLALCILNPSPVLHPKAQGSLGDTWCWKVIPYQQNKTVLSEEKIKLNCLTVLL